MTSTFSSDNRRKAKGIYQYQGPSPLINGFFRSRLESNIATQMEAIGHSFDYEKLKLEYTVPERKSTYTPDFDLKNGIIVEAKGWLTAEDRKKMVLVKKAHPEKDIRFVFQGDPTKRFIYKGSPTSYAKWCDNEGFPWAANGKIPPEWLLVKH